jgi:hypothetical protein
VPLSGEEIETAMKEKLDAKEEEIVSLLQLVSSLYPSQDYVFSITLQLVSSNNSNENKYIIITINIITSKD